MQIGLGLGLTMRRGGGGVPDTSPLKVIVTGQSNADNMFSVSSSPPAAAAGTFFHNGTILTTMPLANGCRELANALKAAFPLRDIHLAEAATSGVSSGYFISGQAGWTDFSAKYTALGGVHLVVVQHGEGDSAANTSSVTPAGVTKGDWKANWTTVSNQIAALAGATIPMLFIGLATYGGPQGTNADDQWWAVQEGIRELCDEYAHIHYSHSMMDAVRLDTYHYDGASYGKSGKRAASLGSTVLGGSGGLAAWFITGATRVSATETDVTVAHALGSDFTPTTGITGFSISGTNGGTWESPSAAVRQSATSIRLTHSSLGTAVDRQVRYLYGTAPVVTGIVLDNSTLAAPLSPSAGVDLFAAGSGSYPVPTWRGAWQSPTQAVSVAIPRVPLGANTASEELMVLITVVTNSPRTLSAITITPAGGSAITGTVIESNVTNQSAMIVRFIIPAATTGLGLADIAITWSSAPFSFTLVNVWTVPTSRLLSTTAVDTDKSTSAAVTVRTVALSSTVNGFSIAAAIGPDTATFTWTGDDTMIERYDRDYGANAHTAADASNIIAGTNDNDITVTSSVSGTMTLVAATFR